LQFVTSSTYRRAPIFSTPSRRELFVEAFRAVRSKLDFPLIGWVLMPEHFHLLFQPWPAQSTSNILKELKQRSLVVARSPDRATRPTEGLRTLRPG
jgi:putative transposase